MIIITNSTAFKEAAYNQENKTLLVEYTTGGKYAYESVTQDEVDNILSSHSRGHALKEIIKGKQFSKL